MIIPDFNKQNFQHPCFVPLSRLKNTVETQLFTTQLLAPFKSTLTHFTKLSPNPNLVSVAKIKLLLTESNAFSMSAANNRDFPYQHNVKGHLLPY